MDTILNGLGGSVPEMVALIVVVVLFLQFLKTQTATTQTGIETQNKAWRDYLTVQERTWQAFIEAQMSLVVGSLKETASDVNGLGAKFEKLESAVHDIGKRLLIHETYVNTAIEGLKNAAREQKSHVG